MTRTDAFTRRRYERMMVLALFCAACGGGATEATAPAAPPAPTTKADEASTPPPSEKLEPTVGMDAPPQPSESAEEPKAAPDPNAERDIRFIKTPEGLRVEILGVKFVPKAVATKTPAGVGMKLTLEATTGEARSLSSPSHGPLAFAGAVKRKGKAEPEAFGDERKGDGEVLLEPAKPTKIVREWPGKNGGALGNGDILELDVGLWGLGTTKDDRRPVKQFLRVKVVVENWKGRALIEPPPSVKGS
jgi:hypothetical protein